MALDNEIAKIQRTLDNLTDRIAKLEGENKFTTGTDWMRANWWGWCSPTLPASKIVNVHGGILWWWQNDMQVGYFSKLDDTVYDFAAAGVFTQSQAYRWCVLQADVTNAIATLRLHEDPTEFGTYEECERDFWDVAPTTDLYSLYIPLCVFVLRNDGLLNVSGAIENVTLADKLQSYIIVRDFRPWIHSHRGIQQ